MAELAQMDDISPFLHVMDASLLVALILLLFFPSSLPGRRHQFGEDTWKATSNPLCDCLHQGEEI